MSRFGLRKGLLVATFGLFAFTGCAPVGYYDQVGYYDPCPYGCGSVVLQYDSYRGRPYYGHPGHYSGRHWDSHRHYWR